MTHIDLFSGTGGFALAALWAGIKTVQFVEIDPFCQKVLQKNFPGVPIHDDIKTFTYTEGRKSGEPSEPEGREDIGGGNRQVAGFADSKNIKPTPFILTGGFPCQPFSAPAPPEGEGFKNEIKIGNLLYQAE
jgi:DNA (cytosine-5)-methyltransferase 1